jgi:hypothetical protein
MPCGGWDLAGDVMQVVSGCVCHQGVPETADAILVVLGVVDLDLDGCAVHVAEHVP